MKEAILSSLQASDIFFYDSEYKIFSIEKEKVEEKSDHIIQEWNKKVPRIIHLMEKRFNEIYNKSNKNITVLENSIVFENEFYDIEIHDKNKMFSVIEEHTDKYFNDSIAFIKKVEEPVFELSLDDFKEKFNILTNKGNITKQDILSFIEWACFSLNIETEDH